MMWRTRCLRAMLALVPALGVAAAPAIFNANPADIWNRTWCALLLRQDDQGREYGADSLDPLLWQETHHLLTGASHRRTLAALDEFLRTHAEREVRDPLERAIFQQDLWAVFDWAASGDDYPRERHELEARLAQVIRRVALTAEQIRSLPDTYSEALAADLAGLPPDLFTAGGPWVCLSAWSDQPTAAVHFTGRSRFLVFMRLPGGREATLAYIRTLRTAHEPPLTGPDGRLLNLKLAQFPAGTEVALVRQAILIDCERHLAPTSITESVQLRVYRTITPGNEFMNFIGAPSSHDQDFVEFRMGRAELFARHNGGLVAIAPRETEFATFSTHGLDEFESVHREGPGMILERCRACHVDSGIHSVQSRLQWMNASGEPTGGDPIAWETRATIRKKEQEPDFTNLVSLW
jgi:hypothetical protein